MQSIPSTEAGFLMSDTYVPESAMAIVAHPDDIEFSCAGTLARWARTGARLAYVICTSGEMGFNQPGIDLAEAAKIREAEQRRAAEIVGTKAVTFLRQPDGLLQPTIELRKMIVREIRRFRPEVVICGDPTIMRTSLARFTLPASGKAIISSISTRPSTLKSRHFERMRAR
jgi:LmbE family N-acetylglucosaminyl deacetylase